MAYVFEPAPTASVPVAGLTAHFPVRRIFCVGRNYAAHAREMGGDERDPPFFFTKPADALVQSGDTIPYPPGTENLHFEAELVIAIGTGGRNITLSDAPGHIYGYASGNDLTRRDLQDWAKENRRPWDMSKGFDLSAVVGPIHRLEEVEHLEDASISLSRNGEVQQDAPLATMIWANDEIVSYLSGLVALRPGDLIMTGTPAGVGPLVPGDTCSVSVTGLSDATVTIGDRA